MNVGEFLAVSRKKDDVVRVGKVKFKQTGGVTDCESLSLSARLTRNPFNELVFLWPGTTCGHLRSHRNGRLARKGDFSPSLAATLDARA